MSLTLVRILALLALVCISPALVAQPAAAKPAGLPALATHVRPDGTLATAGLQGALDPNGYSLALAPDGAPRFVRAAAEPVANGWDDRFGTPGVYDGDVVASAVSESGDLYIAGAFTPEDSSVPASNIARWDGRRFYPLGEGISGGLARVRELATFGPHVYAVGSFTTAGTAAANQVAHWDGTAWAALGNGAGPQLRNTSGTARIYAVAVGPNGDVFVGGNFDHLDDTPANGVARWDGTRWHALGAGLSERGIGDGEERIPAWVYALAVAPDGSLYAGGEFSDAGDIQASGIARWDGTQWNALGRGIRGGGFFQDGIVEAIAINGTSVYVSGLFTGAGGKPAANIAMWDGQNWQTLGAGLITDIDSPAPVLSLVVSDGALYAGGTFTSAGGKVISGVARWDGTAWAVAGPPLAASTGRVQVYTLAAAKPGGVFVGGVFDQAGGVDVHGITLWNGERWENLGQGVAFAGDLDAFVNAVAVDSLGRIYVGGSINTVGGLHVNNIAMWDGSRWHDVGGGVTPAIDGSVRALQVDGTDLYVGGHFTKAGGISANRVAKWDGATGQWSALGAGINDSVYALALGDGVLYAGGLFTQAGESEALDLAMWDGETWQALGGEYEIFEVLDSGNEAGTFVRALAYQGGQLYVGGHFQTIHRKDASTQDKTSYVYVHNLIGYTPGDQTWFTIGQGGAMGVTTNGFSGFSTTVYALAVANDGLYIGGTFNRGGGLLTPSLARWDIRSGVWSSPGVPAAPGSSTLNVTALASAGNQLLVGGTFTSIGTVAARSAALLDTTTGEWDALDGGLGWRNGTARATAAAISADALYLGGQISTAGQHPSLSLARYGGNFRGSPPPPPPAQRQVYLPLTVR